jgi:hypothetical protein
MVYRLTLCRRVPSRVRSARLSTVSASGILNRAPLVSSTALDTRLQGVRDPNPELKNVASPRVPHEGSFREPEGSLQDRNLPCARTRYRATQYQPRRDDASLPVRKAGESEA